MFPRRDQVEFRGPKRPTTAAAAAEYFIGNPVRKAATELISISGVLIKISILGCTAYAFPLYV